MSLGRIENTAFFKTFFCILGTETPTSNEQKFLNDFGKQYLMNSYSSVQAVNNALDDMDYFDMVAILSRFNETEKDVIKIYWGKFLTCNGRTMPSDKKINSMITIAMDSGIDISNLGKYLK